MLDMDVDTIKAVGAAIKATIIGGMSAAVGHVIDVVHGGQRFSWSISIAVVVMGGWLGWVMDGLLPHDLPERGVYIGLVCVAARPVVVGIRDLGPEIAKRLIDRVKRALDP